MRSPANYISKLNENESYNIIVALQKRKTKPQKKKSYLLIIFITIPSRGGNTAEIMTPMTVIVPILSTEEHHQCNYKSANSS